MFFLLLEKGRVFSFSKIESGNLRSTPVTLVVRLNLLDESRKMFRHKSNFNSRESDGHGVEIFVCITIIID